MTWFEKMSIISFSKIKFLQNMFLSPSQKQVSSKNLFISSSKKDNTLRIQRQSSLWEQKSTSGFESKSFDAVK